MTTKTTMVATRHTAVVLLAAALFTTLLVLVLVAWEPLRAVDSAALNGLHAYALAQPGFTTTMKDISTAGSAPVYTVLFTAITLWLLHRRRWRDAVFTAVAEVGGGLLNHLLKFVVNRPRPVVADPIAHASGLSFPSGHAQSAAVAATVLFVLFAGELNRTGQIYLYGIVGLAVALIGFSRVALSVHYVSDVLAGFCAGVTWAICVLLVTNRVWSSE
ncbi:phosphatase PAP2 family protein [Lentzea sp. NPDC058450]|uniref:phosphatase PAP2 family protein n=1 Tax=Lentzea sp. NPDC058450 TaxID=3346505 RepID=UPI00366649BA